jgi:GTP-binding protein
MPRRLFNGVKAALDEGLAQLKDVPLLTVSGKTGKGIDRCSASPSSCASLVAAGARPASSTAGSRRGRAPTRRRRRGKRIKLRYITQVKIRPPSFVVFGNRTDELPESYRRYLVNAMRRDLGFGAVPLRRIGSSRRRESERHSHSNGP